MPEPLRAYCTEYDAPPTIAPNTGKLCDMVYARTRAEADAIVAARRPGNERVVGVMVAEYEECDECGELHGVDYDGDAPAFDHAPLCNRRWIPAPPAIPEGL